MSDLRRHLQVRSLRSRARPFSVRSPRQPLTVSFFGHFGSANAGNESTLLTVLSRFRSVAPETEFRCICSDPQAATARYQIDAVPITTRFSKIRNREVSLGRQVPMAIVGVAEELRQYVRAFRLLKGTDMFIVPGTGLLTDADGIAGWGPYNMFKWVLMAKLRRCRVLFVSVGAGPLDSAAGRTLVKAALSLADYRSYRDESSQNYLTSIGFRADRDPIYPDLVFALPRTLLPPGGQSKGARSVVGIGLMVYTGKYSSARPRAETYTTYLESLSILASWLLERGYDIRLLLGDSESDTSVIEDFRSVLGARLGSYDEERVFQRPITSMHDVLAELAETDIVVATRFHNVLLAMLVDKPVIAITFHHKCSSLMQQMGLSEYCHPIHEMDVDRLIEQFQALERDQDAIRHTIGDGVDQARAALDHQFERLLESRPGQAPTYGEQLDRKRSQRLVKRFLDVNERLWRRMPGGLRELRPARTYGTRMHALARQRADREMYLGTAFLRNRPALELMRRLADEREPGARVTIAVLGCSIGAEVYSILWTLRSSRPDLEVAVTAVDISPDVVAIAQRGVYSSRSSEMVHASIFEPLTEAERQEMFDWNGDEGTIRSWLRAGITWRVGDACDPSLITSIGPHDLVVASNFLCHMTPQDAERCLRNIAGLVAPGGSVFITGVDLDIRTKVAVELSWEPVPELRAEIHDGDPLVRSDWPWRWWGLEPLDQRRPDWRTRYSAVFRTATDRQPSGTSPARAADEASLLSSVGDA